MRIETLTRLEAAKYLNITAEKLDFLVRFGKIDYLKHILNHKYIAYYFLKESLDKYKNEQRTKHLPM